MIKSLSIFQEPSESFLWTSSTTGEDLFPWDTPSAPLEFDLSLTVLTDSRYCIFKLLNGIIIS